jgi:DNA-binding transcriptional regulator YdaS (Cro superfamily)
VDIRDPDKLGVKALKRASEIAGGQSKLRKILGVSAVSFSVWISGAEPLPLDVFVKTVDIITEAELEAMRSNKPRDPG